MLLEGVALTDDNHHFVKKRLLFSKDVKPEEGTVPLEDKMGARCPSGS